MIYMCVNGMYDCVCVHSMCDYNGGMFVYTLSLACPDYVVYVVVMLYVCCVMICMWYV